MSKHEHQFDKQLKAEIQKNLKGLYVSELADIERYLDGRGANTTENQNGEDEHVLDDPPIRKPCARASVAAAQPWNRKKMG